MGLHHLITNLVELMAAFSASYYWLKTKDSKVKPFVWLLWLIVITETVGLYGYILQNNYDNKYFIWLKNSVFCENRWLFNIYTFLSIIFLGLFFKRNLNDAISKKTINIIVIISSIFAIIYYSVTNGFFIKSIPYDAAFQTLVVFVFVMLYLRELIKSDEILEFYKSHVFYISLGLLLWYLCVTPLVIFDAYFYDINKNFITFRHTYLLISNILLYSCYTFAFIYSLYHKKRLVPKK